MAKLRRDEIFKEWLPILIEGEVERSIIATQQQKGRTINKVGRMTYEVIKPDLKIKTIKDYLFKAIGKL